jgi:hypothetical protein
VAQLILSDFELIKRRVKNNSTKDFKSLHFNYLIYFKTCQEIAIFATHTFLV